jgi:transcription initiation factor IIE alpha subunit
VLEGLKEDYEARMDRLQCPKCRKYQSFDEFMEKRRICGPCQERFVKLHVSKFKSWEAKQTEREEKKEAKLKKINEEVYGVCSFAPQVNQM